MKKFVLFAFLATMIFSMPVSDCEARDVWVEHWDYENVDIYIMDDTIAPANSERDYFSVTTKQVRNGKLLKTVIWKFSKYMTDMWRYETSTMDGMHTTVVIPKNGIFEFCMNRLGWSYRIKGNYYY